MNVREAHELITELETDLAAEPNPNDKAWYEQEFKLQNNYLEAEKTMAAFNAVVGLIGQIASIKSVQGEAAGQPEAPTEGPELLVDDTIVEQPRKLTPEEILHNRIKRKYDACFRRYDVDSKAITTTKRKKREHQERIVRRRFAREFSNFVDITGDAHIVMRADLLEWATTELCDDESLANELFANSAEYAEKYAVEVTGDSVNFAKIIACSSEGQPLAGQFERVLKGIFSTTSREFPAIHRNLASAAFELMDDADGLRQLTEIALLKKPYVPAAFHAELYKEDLTLLADGDLARLLDNHQINTIYALLNTDVTGLNLPTSNKELEARIKTLLNPQTYKQLLQNLPESDREMIETLLDQGSIGVRVFDPVEIIDLAGAEAVDLGLKPLPENLRTTLEQSTLFRKRMQELAPFSYSLRASKKILGGGGVGLIYALSPSISVDIIIPSEGNTLPDELQVQHIHERYRQLLPDILSTATQARELGMSSYEETGTLKILYHPLYEDDERKGVIHLRPAIPLDKRAHTPLQQMSLNYALIKRQERQEERPSVPTEMYQEQNEFLRKTIKAEHERFLGRRPIKFSMPADLRRTRLESLSLRLDPKTDTIKAKFQLDDGEVELSLDRDFHIDISLYSKASRPFGSMDVMRAYYENLILKLVKIWACSREVRTSEGAVSERTRISANMGHFRYLWIRPEDGYKYRFREDQRIAYHEEQKGDLAQASEERKLRDETGQERNSTYVREDYDPDKPPLVVYYSPSDLD